MAYTTSNPDFTLQFPAASGSSEIETEFHYETFANPVIILQLGVPVAATVKINSWSVDYVQDSLDLTDPGVPLTVTGAAGQIIFGGQHQGIFTNNEWRVRNDKPSLATSAGRVRSLLPGSYYAGHYFAPDPTASKDVKYTVNCTFMCNVILPKYPASIPITVTFSNIVQTVKNQWDRTKGFVPGFISKGAEN